jgi:hypothetical protein
MPCTYCAGCRQPILDRDATDIRPVEQLVDIPQESFGGSRDLLSSSEW